MVEEISFKEERRRNMVRLGIPTGYQITLRCFGSDFDLLGQANVAAGLKGLNQMRSQIK